MDQKAAQPARSHKRREPTDDSKSGSDDGQRREDRSAPDGNGKDPGQTRLEAETQNETLVETPLVEPEAPVIEVKKPRKPRGPYAKTHAKPSDDDLNAIRFVAMTATASLSALAVGLLRDVRAAMTNEESALIAQTAEQTLLTLSNEARERINKYAAPGMLLTAIGTWAIRVATLPKPERSKQAVSVSEMPQSSSAEDIYKEPMDEGHNPELVETFGRRL